MGVPGIVDKREDVIGTCRDDRLYGVPSIHDLEKAFFSSSFMGSLQAIPFGGDAETVHAHTHDHVVLRTGVSPMVPLRHCLDSALRIAASSTPEWTRFMILRGLALRAAAFACESAHDTCRPLCSRTFCAFHWSIGCDAMRWAMSRSLVSSDGATSPWSRIRSRNSRSGSAKGSTMLNP